jgi:hypothetical protein
MAAFMVAWRDDFACEKWLPIPLIIVHASLATIGFVLLLVSVLGLARAG